MRQCAVDKLEVGMVLARPIYDDQFRMLLGPGAVLSGEYIARLVKFNYSYVYIAETGTENIVAEDMIDVQDRKKIFEKFQGIERVGSSGGGGRTGYGSKTSATIKSSSSGRMRMIRNASESLLDRLMQRQVKYYYPSVNLASDMQFNHSFDVAMMAVMIGTRLHYSKSELNNLAMAAMLHDIGKTLLPPELENIHPLDRTPEQEAQYREHPRLGAELILDDRNVPPQVAIAVLQHHENFDGTGYPEGIQGDPNPPFMERKSQGGIFRWAEVISVVDHFDNLVNGRVRKEYVTPIYAIKELMQLVGRRFHPRVVVEAASVINVFPVGSIVRVKHSRNTQIVDFRGVVAKVNEGDLHHPQVLLLYDNRNKRIPHPQPIDFSQEEGSYLEYIMEC